MLSLAPKLPLYWSFRRFGWPKLYPFSVVVSVSFRCNSKCRTCDVWRKPNDDMSAEEWDKVFANLGRTPFYITFTGGEPFLRRDLDEMVISAYRHCRPSVITIPTNGLLTDRVVERTQRICQECPGSQIGLNLSLDGVGEEHDDIRGVPGNWERSMATWKALKELQKTQRNLILTVHTVVSRFNQHRFQDIYRDLQFLQPDSYITEVAEERVELDTVGWGITPEPDAYAPIADFLSAQARSHPARGLARVTQAFRAQYYQLAKRVLYERTQVIDCYAGWASAHIAPNGDIWSCCIRAEPVGCLRETGYDLAPIWFGERMAALRKSIYNKECACPMANANYANMLLHPPTVAKVALDVLKRD
ncbi:MAG: Antilisterial bacteriocin subtilosin biosynthesis protein AlbA [Chloroflexi bacterium ADurb.Bin325]|nr:MAG: Antilisterial bacteriocin subtilosin biosynthesis protein AlbA [Chloroflexi bacterium ADurb.Bin325]